MTSTTENDLTFEPRRRWSSDAAPVGPPDRRLWVAAAAIAVTFDLAVGRPAASLAAAACLAVVAATPVATGRVRSRHGRITALLVPVLSAFLVLRASPWLTAITAGAAMGLLVAAAATDAGGSLTSYGFRDFTTMPARLATRMVRVTTMLPEDLLAAETGRVEQATRLTRGLAMAAPIVLVVGVLLATGDRAFSDVVATMMDGGMARHALILTVGLFAGLAFLRAAGSTPSDPVDDPVRRVGAVEVVTVMVALAALYALFAVAQVVATFDDVDEILADPGETADWVHEGFFRLLWASGITMASMLGFDHLADIGGARQHRMYRRSVLALVAFTLVSVVVAIVRIVQYSSTFGLTMLRLYSIGFATWIGIVFVLFALRTWPGAGDRRWFATAVATTVVVGVVALNVADPEQIVVDVTLDHAEQVDIEYLSGLSADGIDRLLERWDDLSAHQQDELAARVCGRGFDDAGGLSWNLARSSVEIRLARRC